MSKCFKGFGDCYFLNGKKVFFSLRLALKSMKQKWSEMVQVTVPIFFILMKSKKLRRYGQKHTLFVLNWPKSIFFRQLLHFSDFIKMKENQKFSTTFVSYFSPQTNFLFLVIVLMMPHILIAYFLHMKQWSESLFFSLVLLFYAIPTRIWTNYS